MPIIKQHGEALRASSIAAQRQRSKRTSRGSGSKASWRQWWKKTPSAVFRTMISSIADRVQRCFKNIQGPGAALEDARTTEEEEEEEEEDNKSTASFLGSIGPSRGMVNFVWSIPSKAKEDEDERAGGLSAGWGWGWVAPAAASSGRRGTTAAGAAVEDEEALTAGAAEAPEENAVAAEAPEEAAAEAPEALSRAEALCRIFISCV
jgi:hypothetical protein